MPKRPDAAEALEFLRLICLELKVIDKILPEPTGGAHRNHQLAAQIVKGELLASLRTTRTALDGATCCSDD